jgi:hypothetical protein
MKIKDYVKLIKTRDTRKNLGIYFLPLFLGSPPFLGVGNILLFIKIK